MRELLLEDTAAEVIAKAQRALGMDDEALARVADLRLIELQALKEGKADAPILLRAAPALGLRAEALAELARGWRPKPPPKMPNLRVFSSPRPGRSHVNAYLFWDPVSNNGVAFDTGTDACPMLQFTAEHHIRLQMVLLTHSHPSHVAELTRIIAATDARGFISKGEAFPGVETFEPGHNFRAGNLIIATRLTSGHSRGGITYIIKGLPEDYAVVGDALFAASMGEAFISYSDALDNCCEHILTLPGKTILCPGHGPLTTVTEEKQHNPFFPQFSPSWPDAAGQPGSWRSARSIAATG